MGWYCEPIEAPLSIGYCKLSKDKCEQIARDQGVLGECQYYEKAACFDAESKLEGQVAWCFTSFERCESTRKSIRAKKADYTKVKQCKATKHPGLR